MNEKKFFALYFLFVLSVCCCLVASPQSYLITEQQLQKLEMESRSWNEKNLKLQESNQKLTEQVKKLNEQTEKLETLSLDRQKTIEQLTKSCSKLESNLYNEREQHNKDIQELNKIKLREQKQKTTIVVLISIISVLILLIGIGIFLKIKKLF